MDDGFIHVSSNQITMKIFWTKFKIKFGKTTGTINSGKYTRKQVEKIKPLQNSTDYNNVFFNKSL